MSENEKDQSNQGPDSQTSDPNAHQPMPAGTAEPNWTELQAELSTLKAKNGEMADSYLRAKAEAENARRRAEEEIAKARKFAVESPVRPASASSHQHGSRRAGVQHGCDSAPEGLPDRRQSAQTGSGHSGGAEIGSPRTAPLEV
jgi:ElaB/YqjD/DUF883 family membrane-anchored ribosome-binding protein